MLKAKMSRVVICVILFLGFSHAIINYFLYTNNGHLVRKDDSQDITLR